MARRLGHPASGIPRPSALPQTDSSQPVRIELMQLPSCALLTQLGQCASAAARAGGRAPRNRRRYHAALSALLAGLLLPAAAQTPAFADLSLEQLVHYEVSTLGRKNAAVFDTPAPAYVLSADDIHRSGATTLAEALRLAPGVQVSRIDSVNYAIAVRGFNDATSSKLLVLKDGRSVYNQLSSGTNWGLLDLVLEDVSRIEVQRGPAGTLWGANAVNGVINIVTKNAHSTLGSFASVARGNELDAAVTVRHGFSVTPTTAARVYAKYQEQGDFGAPAGAEISGWNSRLVGTRFDWDRPGGGGFSASAEFRELRTDAVESLPQLLPPYQMLVPEQRRARSAELSLRWSQPVGTDGQLSALAAVERGDNEQFQSGERHTTADLEVQLTLRPLPRHEVIAGTTVRATDDRLRNTRWLTYDDPRAATNFAGAFLQDEITLIPERLDLTVGCKFERNSYSGWETQPSLRALWHPTRSQSAWLAVSRAARTPSRSERGVHFFAGAAPPGPVYPLPVAIVASGAPDFSSEHVTSYELGHRFAAGPTFSVDTALFYSKYYDLRGLRPGFFPPDFATFPPHFNLVLDAANNLRGHTSGGEVSLHWHAHAQIELNASVASVRTSLREIGAGLLADPSVLGLTGNTPHEEYKLHATWHPNARWTVDLMARHTGRLPASGVPAYLGLDLRLGWSPRPDLEVELVGRDLGQPDHPETASSFLGTGAQPIARSVFLRFTVRR